MNAAGDTWTLEREMGCTRAEFVRWLPGATRQAPLQVGEDSAVVRTGNFRVDIAFIAAPPRRIALLSLPVLRVSFRFSGGARDDHDGFLAFFDLYTKRGGG